MSLGSGSDTESLIDVALQPTRRRQSKVPLRERATRVFSAKAELPISSSDTWRGALELCQRGLRCRMGAAAGVQDTIPVAEWLVTACGDIEEPVEFHGGIISASVAARTLLQVLRNVFRSGDS